MTLEQMDFELAEMKARNATHRAASIAEIEELLRTETNVHAREFLEKQLAGFKAAGATGQPDAA
ncbi:hypothetical protein [Catenulispora pinisilvae]|uniref:hypothetical protein n=1 Tax=Catenulispora pinisilvae TaxID=2705253 RepID=UPI001891F359|nr:hypothetical protein [Catenulispora pinisilvae]